MRTTDRESTTERRPASMGGFRQNSDLLTLVVLAVVTLSGWLAAELADAVSEGATQKWDEWVLVQLRTPGDMTDPIGLKWFEDVWRDITALGSPTVLGLVTMACAGYLLIRRRYRMLTLLLIATAGGAILSLLLKTLFDRPRPGFAAAGMHVTMSSFPSSHSMLSAVVYLTLGALLARTTTELPHKLYFVAVSLLITILVGLSRIYLGVHYPTDVLAGWSFGLIWAILCWLIARLLQKRGAIEPLDK